MRKNPWDTKVIRKGSLEEIMSFHPVLNHKIKEETAGAEPEFLKLVSELLKVDEEYQNLKIDSELGKVLHSNAEFLLEEKIKEKTKVLLRLTAFVEKAGEFPEIIGKDMKDPLKPGKQENNSYFMIPFEKRKPFLSALERLKELEQENADPLYIKLGAFAQKIERSEKVFKMQNESIQNSISSMENL